MYGHLIPTGGGDPIPLLKEELTVGRRESCDITLRFSNVSSKHCQLILSHGYWYVRDLNSSNGTKVAGIRVQEKRLDPGTIVSFAKNSYEVRYDPADNGAVGPPPPDVLDTNILGKSLLERAGLQKRDVKSVRPRRDGYEDRSYDVLDDSAGQLNKMKNKRSE